MTDLHPGIQAAVDRLNAERYGPPLWWPSKATERARNAAEDNDLETARRRRVLLENYIGDERETGSA